MKGNWCALLALVFAGVLVLFAGSDFAQTVDTLTVTDMKTCTGVQNREPVGVAETFAHTVGRVFCFTVVEGVKEPTTITHVWYHGETKRGEVSLKVNPPRWRTWSSKTIAKTWTGHWRVEVVSAEGKVLKSTAFEITGEGK